MTSRFKLWSTPLVTTVGLTVVWGTLGCSYWTAPGKVTQAPPATRTDNVAETLHGVELVDPYRWLEDQKSPETRAWINAQNAYTDSQLQRVAGREELRKLATRLLKIIVERCWRGAGLSIGRQFDQLLYVSKVILNPRL